MQRTDVTCLILSDVGTKNILNEPETSGKMFTYVAVTLLLLKKGHMGVANSCKVNPKTRKHFHF